MLRYFVIWTFLFAAIVGAAAALAQAYPTKPVRLVTGDAGGPNDFGARLISPALSASLGQQVIVDNRTWIDAIRTVARATPDGYTLLIYASIVWLAPLMRDDLPWDPIRDFSPITLAGTSPNVLVVSPTLPAQSVSELIAHLKARPGALNCATGPAGSTTHLAAEAFKAMAGVNVVRVPFKGNIPALSAVVGGQVQMMFANAASAAPYIKGGRVRALAVTSAQPSALAPGLPTMAASGLPGYEVVSILGMFAPAKTPTALINRLNQEIVQALNRPEVKEKLYNTGIEVVGSTPQQLGATMKSEMSRLGKIIKDAGIRDQ